VYNRKYSLKTRYNFNKVFREGNSFKSAHLIIIRLPVSPEVFKDDVVDKKFAVIVSSKFNKKAVIKNRVRRIIAESIRLKIEKFPSNHYYVIIPKKEILNGNGKVKRISKEISSELDSFLSKVAVV
jgi:ribonuclease P protein component